MSDLGGGAFGDGTVELTFAYLVYLHEAPARSRPAAPGR